ncbi:hypothetical protein Zmor_007728 [Zophobas morio]|uniref:glutathione transferase n=1 Tax=Zophobas morio TaxID=2755281 RepID=A0AA38IYZ1_9CUCU|nr:hypothetical protein Zmor_007728 [Zophobas morio]
MAPLYKLTYFDGRGFAESARFLFKYGNIDFEDIRIKRQDWPKMKNSTPFGQVPVMEHNGKQICQSAAICRYLGKMVNLAGNNDWENLEIDSIVDTMNDLRMKIMLVQWEQDAVKKRELKDTVLEEIVPYYLARLEALVEKNKGNLAVGRLTWADLYFVSMSPGFDAFIGGDTFAAYPNLKLLRDKVETLPGIKEWIENRPNSDF